jgi:signal transduction histidine kinase
MNPALDIVQQAYHAFGRQDIPALLASENCPANFEAGAELGTNRERERLSTYFHDQLAPDLMSVAFAVEAIRSELEIENHPAEAKLAKVRDRLSKMLQPIRESILGLSEHDQ